MRATSGVAEGLSRLLDPRASWPQLLWAVQLQPQMGGGVRAHVPVLRIRGQPPGALRDQQHGTTGAAAPSTDPTVESGDLVARTRFQGEAQVTSLDPCRSNWRPVQDHCPLPRQP